MNEVIFAAEMMMKSDSETMFPVMEKFTTLQGEGKYAGTLSYFVRLGGCDVGCHWCDVKDSWQIDAHPSESVESILAASKESNAKIVVVTGGEPTMHDLEPITRALGANEIERHIETSGAHSLTGTWDWVTFSPKKFKAPVEGFGKLASELKVIIYNRSDFQFAEEHAKTVSDDCLLYLQPEWEVREKAMPLIVEYIKQNPRWKISIQAHKYINIP